MLERRSALASATPYRSPILEIGETPRFSLTQIAGVPPDCEERLKGILGALPQDAAHAVQSNGRTIMRTGPAQLWIVGPEHDDVSSLVGGLGAVTPLSHSRCRIALDGAPARDVLAKGIALDFHKSAFVPGMFAQTGLHHTPVLVHCVADHRFELYALRTFALSVWQWLTDAALEFAAD